MGSQHYLERFPHILGVNINISWLNMNNLNVSARDVNYVIWAQFNSEQQNLPFPFRLPVTHTKGFPFRRKHGKKLSSLCNHLVVVFSLSFKVLICIIESITRYKIYLHFIISTGHLSRKIEEQLADSLKYNINCCKFWMLLKLWSVITKIC